MRLEDDKLETLRRWGQGLREAGGEEQAASGRAILLLIEEIERLRLELLRTREQWSREDQKAIIERLKQFFRQKQKKRTRRHGHEHA